MPRRFTQDQIDEWEAERANEDWREGIYSDEREVIDRSFADKTLTPELWAAHWDSISIEHDDDYTVHHDLVFHLLDCLERLQHYFPKDWVADEAPEGGARLLAEALEEKPQLITRWAEHCIAQGNPMTAQDWRESGVFYGLLRNGDNAKHLFDPAFWKAHGTMDECVALCETLMDFAETKDKVISPKVNEAMGDLLSHFFEEAANVTPVAVKQHLESLPSSLKDALPNSHQLSATISRARRSQARDL